MKFAQITDNPEYTPEGIFERVGQMLSPSITLGAALKLSDPSGPYRQNVEEFLKKTVGNKYWLKNVGPSGYSAFPSSIACIDGRDVQDPIKLLAGLERGTATADNVIKVLKPLIELRQRLIKEITGMRPNGDAEKINQVYNENKASLPDDAEAYRAKGGKIVKGITGAGDLKEDTFPYSEELGGSFTGTFHADDSHIDALTEKNIREYTNVIGSLLTLMDHQNQMIEKYKLPRWDETPMAANNPGVGYGVRFDIFAGGTNFISPMMLMRKNTHTMLAEMLHAIWPKM